jgi:hypothetical protein
LRESWQALFFLLSVYWAIRLRKRRVSNILIYANVCFLYGITACGLKAYAVYLILASIYWGIFGRKRAFVARL